MKINEQLTEIILAFILPLLIIFMLNFQIFGEIFGVVNGFYVYLMLGFGEVGLAIMLNLEEKKKVKK